MEINSLGLSGWKVVQLSTVQAMAEQAEAGTGPVVITVILEHELPG
jgi:hypothetical protein